jgi:hypothetical protein
MSTSDRALFTTDDGEVFTATAYSRGPWDPASCHGGPVAALLARAVEASDGDSGDVTWHVARLTLELTRPVPVGRPLAVGTMIERPGRKVSLVAATLTTEGTEVARSRALRIRTADIALPADLPEDEVAPLAPLGTAEPHRMEFPGVPNDTAFHSHGVEHRFTYGGPDVAGPVGVWSHLLVPVIAGEDPSGVQRAVAAADFGNGVSAALGFDRYIYINPDLTVHLVRPVVGEWIGMRSESLYAQAGTGLAESALFDVAGRVGRGCQSLFVDVR